jgi:hypothetical protein
MKFLVVPNSKPADVYDVKQIQQIIVKINNVSSPMSNLTAALIFLVHSKQKFYFYSKLCGYFFAH